MNTLTNQVSALPWDCHRLMRGWDRRMALARAIADIKLVCASGGDVDCLEDCGRAFWSRTAAGCSEVVILWRVDKIGVSDVSPRGIDREDERC